jgi:hypothetical protein
VPAQLVAAADVCSPGRATPRPGGQMWEVAANSAWKPSLVTPPMPSGRLMLRGGRWFMIELIRSGICAQHPGGSMDVGHTTSIIAIPPASDTRWTPGQGAGPAPHQGRVVGGARHVAQRAEGGAQRLGRRAVGQPQAGDAAQVPRVLLRQRLGSAGCSGSRTSVLSTRLQGCL